MSKRSDKLLILDVLDSINKILDYTAEQNFRDFLKDSRTVDAVTRNLEIIGEASKHISRKTKDKIELPWKRIIGMRNIIVHEYFGVDTKIVWKIITNQIDELKTFFEQALKDLDK